MAPEGQESDFGNGFAGESAVEGIERRVIRLLAMVCEALAGATDALLSGDRQAARTVAYRDDLIEDLFGETEELVLAHLTSGNRATDRATLDFLAGVLRMLPDIERSGDLADHIARRAVRGLGVELSPRARGLVERMGEVTTSMWQAAADAFADRSVDLAESIDTLDDEVDDLHVTLTAEIASGSMPLPVAIESALVARFYERLGDHAVNLARAVIAFVRAVPPRSGRR